MAERLTREELEKIAHAHSEGPPAGGSLCRCGVPRYRCPVVRLLAHIDALEQEREDILYQAAEEREELQRDLAEARAREAALVEVIKDGCHWLAEAIRERLASIDGATGPHLQRLASEMRQDLISLTHMEQSVLADISPAAKELLEYKESFLRSLQESLETEALWKLQQRREMEAIARWRKEDPSRELKQPDYGRLLDWLLARAERGSKAVEIEELEAIRADHLTHCHWCQAQGPCDEARLLSHIETLDTLLEEAREALESAAVQPWPKIVRDVLQAIRERQEEG